MTAEIQFQPGERITHPEYGQGVVLDPARDGYLRAFFCVGERRVPVASLRRELTRTERILRAVDGGAERSRKAWLSYEAHALPVMESASALTSAKIDLLPHQVVLTHRIATASPRRYLIADEVGLGKTIEAGLVLRELKLRGRVKRVLVVAPKGLVRQWQAEMRLHFGEHLQFIEPSELAAFRQWRSGNQGDEDNLWRMHDQVICSLDSVKPMESRRGWSLEQLNNYNRERFEDLISASWDLVIIDEAHRMGGSTEQVARYKLGAALAEASPYLLLLSATPHQGKTDQFLRLMQLLDREAFPDESSVNRDRVRPFVIRT